MPFRSDYKRLSLPHSQNGQASLSNRRVWTAVRRGIGILGPRLEPGGALLLDDVHSGNVCSFG